MSKPVILTGLRANNDLHIGNYFGALLPMVDMATAKSDEYQINLFVPDLHSFTTPTDLSTLQTATMNNLRVYAAAGLPLENPDVHVYRQSYVPAHSELTWILNCFTGMGEMSRMTQFKDKSSKIAEDRIGVGLFDYPVLMAADILLYGAKYVPVGDDQTQHLEFTRDIALRMNAMAEKYGHEPVFTVPEPVAKQHEFFGSSRGSNENHQGLRIMDLADPAKKMSKSDDTGKGVIFLTDDPEMAKKKVMSATTDSIGRVNYDSQNQPGITNLLDIYELLGGDTDEFIGHEQYGPLKEAVAEKVAKFLANFQGQLENVSNETILAKLEQSEQAMNIQAGATLLRVQQAVGLRPKGA